jgi:hypothetical protein
VRDQTRRGFLLVLVALGSVFGEFALSQPAPATEERRTEEGTPRVVAPGETLFSISREWSEQTGTTLAQSIYGIYRANPNAFGARGIGGLLSGATLRLPSAGVLRQRSPREAAIAVGLALGQKSEPAQTADTTPELPAEVSEPVEVVSSIEEPRVISGQAVETETSRLAVLRPTAADHTTFSLKWLWSPWLWGGLGVLFGSLATLVLSRALRRSAASPAEERAAAMVSAVTTAIARSLAAQSEQLHRLIKKELVNANRQIESFLNVQAALAGGDVIPSLHGWPISPDLAAYLIELIRTNDYDLVIEFGSGSSTVIMAKALSLGRHRREGKAPVVQVAFEHLETYHAQTQGLLRTAGVADAVTVHFAPLVPYQAANGQTYSYCQCEQGLQALGQRYDVPSRRALVLVDGPPAATGEHARYPSLSAVSTTLPSIALDIVLDDLIREDEQQVVRLWQHDLQLVGRGSTVEIRKMEKDACLIRVQPLVRRAALS